MEKQPYIPVIPNKVSDAAEQIVKLLADKKMSYANASHALYVAKEKIKGISIVQNED